MKTKDLLFSKEAKEELNKIGKYKDIINSYNFGKRNIVLNFREKMNYYKNNETLDIKNLDFNDKICFKEMEDCYIEFYDKFIIEIYKKYFLKKKYKNIIKNKFHELKYICLKNENYEDILLFENIIKN